MSDESLKARLKGGELVPQVQQAGNALARIEQMSAAAVMELVPSHLDRERFKRDLFLELRRNPKLAECKPSSVAAAFVECARKGLSLGDGHVFLIPRNSKVKWKDEAGNWQEKWESQATFQVGVKGKLELMRRSGLVSAIDTMLVCERDEFEARHTESGTVISHRPNYRESRGTPQFAYATARLRDGSVQVRILDVDEIAESRSRAAGWRECYKPPQGWQDKPNFREGPGGKVQELTGPWVTDPYAMWMKVALDRLLKMLPQSVEVQDLNRKDGQVLALPQSPDGDTMPMLPAYDSVTGEVVDAGYREDQE